MEGGVSLVVRYNDGMNAQQRYALKRKQIALNVSAEQYERWTERAARQGMTLNEWIRQAIADREQWENENA